MGDLRAQHLALESAALEKAPEHDDKDVDSSTLAHSTSSPSVAGGAGRDAAETPPEAIDEKHAQRLQLKKTLSVAGNETGAVIAESRGGKVGADAVATEGTAEEEYPSFNKFIVIFAAVTLTTFLVLLDTSIIVTAIPYITSRFHSLQDVGWYGAAYLLANAALQPLTGKVYTYFNSKVSYLIFLFVFEVGSLLSGVATSSKMFIVGRAVAGMGCSGLFNGGLTIMAAGLPVAKRPMFTGILMGVAQLGILLGPIFGGLLTQYSTWRWCFYLNLPCGAAIALPILLLSIPSKHISSDDSWYQIILRQFDLVGFGLFAPAVVMLLLALQWGGVNYDWDSSVIIGLLCGFGITLGVFIYWEHRVGDKAMIPLAMIRRPVIWCSCAMIGLLFASLLTTSFYLPIYFQTTRGTSATMSGVYLLPTILPTMIASIGSGVLIGKIGKIPPFVICSGVLAAISGGLLSTLSLNTSSGKWIGYQIIGGFGRGLGMQMAIVAAQNNTLPSQISTAMALVIFAQTLGGALFLSLDQTIFQAELRRVLPRFAPTVEVQTIIDAGATAVRDLITDEDVLQGVLRAYVYAIDRVFYLAAGAAAAYVFTAFGIGWKDVSGSKKVVELEGGEGAEPSTSEKPAS